MDKDGFIAVQGATNKYCCPDLMRGDEHFHDIPKKNLLRSKMDQDMLPHALLHQFVIDSHKTRPKLHVK